MPGAAWGAVTRHRWVRLANRRPRAHDDDFQLWLTLPDGTHGAVAPVDRRGSGDGHVRLVHVPEGSEAADTLAQAQDQGLMAVLPPNSSAALQAFAEQIHPGRRTASGPLVTGRPRRNVRGSR